MKSGFLALAAFAVLVGFPAWAQDSSVGGAYTNGNGGIVSTPRSTSSSAGSFGGNATSGSVGNPFSGGGGVVVPDQAVGTDAPQKSVRDMTAEERQLMWNQLPEEQKQRILERRQKAAAEKARQNKWKNLSGKQPGATPSANAGTATTMPARRDGSWNSDPNLTPQQRASIQRGADLWKSMTPEQKKAFVSQHRDKIHFDNSNTTYKAQ